MTVQEINRSVPRPEAADELADYDLDEPTKAKILEDVKIGLQQALAGEGQPAREISAELRRKIVRVADSG